MLVESPGPLDDYAVASRLSYFLWSTLPDETLAALAADGTLARPDVLASQVDRLLADRDVNGRRPAHKRDDATE